jgi:hypothetical protein
MPSLVEKLTAALAVKARECSALRQELCIVDLNPWRDRLVIEKSDLEFGKSLHPVVSETEDGGLLLELSTEVRPSK